MRCGRGVVGRMSVRRRRCDERGAHLPRGSHPATDSAFLGPPVQTSLPVRVVARVTSSTAGWVVTGWGTRVQRLEVRGDFLAVAEGRFGRAQAAYATEREIRDALRATVVGQDEGVKEVP